MKLSDIRNDLENNELTPTQRKDAFEHLSRWLGERPDDAEAKGAQIVILTDGGVLAERAKKHGYPYYKDPIGLQPRVAVCYGVKALTDLFTDLGLIDGVQGELSEAVEFMSASIKLWGADIATDENPAKKLANDLLGHEIVMYGGPTTGVASLKWKINFNETSKNLSFYYNYPEFNHNEFMGWTHPQNTNIKVVELLSDLDHPQIGKRFEISNRLLSGTMPAPIVIQADGENKLQQMLWVQMLGDFVSVYLGVLNGIDPTPVPLIEKLKKELA